MYRRKENGMGRKGNASFEGKKDLVLLNRSKRWESWLRKCGRVFLLICSFFFLVDVVKINKISLLWSITVLQTSTINSNWAFSRDGRMDWDFWYSPPSFVAFNPITFKLSQKQQKIGDEGVKWIISALNHPSLHITDLDIFWTGWDVIGQFLLSNTTLMRLNIYENDFENVGMRGFCEGLKKVWQLVLQDWM